MHFKRKETEKPKGCHCFGPPCRSGDVL